MPGPMRLRAQGRSNCFDFLYYVKGAAFGRAGAAGCGRSLALASSPGRPPWTGSSARVAPVFVLAARLRLGRAVSL